MKKVIFVFSALGLVLSGLAAMPWMPLRGGPESCSTFMMRTGEVLLVGHNLVERFETPGQVVVNKRGVSKQNLGWQDIKTPWKRDDPRVRWVSKYGSITYNTLGKEFIDGGLNDAGLYIGEMTLLGSKYPSDPKVRSSTTTNGCSTCWTTSRASRRSWRV